MLETELLALVQSVGRHGNTNSRREYVDKSCLNTVVVDVVIVFLDDICQKLLAVALVTLDGWVCNKPNEDVREKIKLKDTFPLMELA